jgi:hypothetical protein
MPPQINAQLIQVNTDGASDDWDITASLGGAVWSGSAGVYVQEKVRTNFSQSAGSLVKTKDIQIVLDAPLVQAIGIDSGHILTFSWRGQIHSRRVIEYNGADLAGVPNYVRIHLRPEPLEITLESQ